MAISAPKARRLGYVDGLRALAALEVVACHIYGTVNPHSALLAAIGGYGLAAVAVFIVLSGFSLSLPVARAGWRISDGALGFYRRRARRILPPYYAALALSLFCATSILSTPTHTVWGDNLPITWVDVAQRAALIQDFTNRATINYVFWSIAVECHIYLAFPLLVAAWRRYARLFLLVLGVALTSVLTFAARLAGFPALYQGGAAYLFAYAGLFVVGMFAASLHVRPSRMSEWLTRCFIWDGLALALLVACLIYTSRWSAYAQAALFGVWTLAALSSPLAQRVLEWRPLVWIGGFSYSLYLIHAPLIQLIWQYGLHPLRLGPDATYLALLLLGLPVITLAAWGFWRLAERPFLNTRPVARRAAAGSAAEPARLASPPGPALSLD
ncbi:MAG TPA: acyltransferase [Ktedonobacterales bacterium]